MNENNTEINDMNNTNDMNDINDTNNQNTINNTTSINNPNTINITNNINNNMNTRNIMSSMLTSDRLVSQLSLNSNSTNRHFRSDLTRNRLLERYLASDLSSHNDSELLIPPVIWGTTVNIENSMQMFKDFITNYSVENDTPFYDSYLAHVSLSK